MESASSRDSRSPRNDSEPFLGASSESNTKPEESAAATERSSPQAALTSPPEEGLSTRIPGLVMVGVAAMVIHLDQLSKWWALERLGSNRDIELFLGIKLNLVFNDGAAFSTGGGLGPLFGAAAVLVSIWLFSYARRLGGRMAPVVLGLVAGGALGNVVDRMVRDGDGFLGGRVVDFIDFGWWPVFNVADIAIVSGVMAMMVVVVRNPEL